MKIETSIGTLKIRWKHSQENGMLGPVPIKGLSQCSVLLEDMNIGVGVAGCSVRDVFSKEAGRRVSLKRAIETLPRPVRAEIWAGYHGR